MQELLYWHITKARQHYKIKGLESHPIGALSHPSGVLHVMPIEIL